MKSFCYNSYVHHIPILQHCFKFRRVSSRVVSRFACSEIITFLRCKNFHEDLTAEPSRVLAQEAKLKKQIVFHMKLFVKYQEFAFNSFPLVKFRISNFPGKQSAHTVNVSVVRLSMLVELFSFVSMREFHQICIKRKLSSAKKRS